MKSLRGARIAPLLFLFALASSPAATSDEQRTQTPGPTPTPRSWFLVLYDRTNYRGTKLSFDSSAASLGDYGRGVSSLKIDRGVWELCEDKNFSGRCVTLGQNVPDLGVYGMRGRVGSVRPARSPSNPSEGRWYVIVFDRTSYRGTPINYDGPMPVLGDVGRRAASVTIGRGVWEFCDGPDYKGHCTTLDQSVPNLDAYHLGSRLGSLRPLRPETPPTPTPR